MSSSAEIAPQYSLQRLEKIRSLIADSARPILEASKRHREAVFAAYAEENIGTPAGRIFAHLAVSDRAGSRDVAVKYGIRAWETMWALQGARFLIEQVREEFGVPQLSDTAHRRIRIPELAFSPRHSICSIALPATSDIAPDLTRGHVSIAFRSSTTAEELAEHAVAALSKTSWHDAALDAGDLVIDQYTESAKSSLAAVTSHVFTLVERYGPVPAGVTHELNLLGRGRHTGEPSPKLRPKSPLHNLRGAVAEYWFDEASPQGAVDAVTDYFSLPSFPVADVLGLPELMPGKPLSYMTEEIPGTTVDGSLRYSRSYVRNFQIHHLFND